MKNKFLTICFGISMVTCSVAFLIRSAQTAQATPTPSDFIEEGTNHIGKYMILGLPSTSDTNESYTIWDTETGKSVRYTRSSGSFYKEYSLPEHPLE